MALRRQFLWFALSGTLAFVLDSAVLHLLMQAGINAYVARAISFVCAASFTWIFNRLLTFNTFEPAPLLQQWLRWMLAMGLGGLVNYALFAGLYAGLASVRAWPVIGVAAGSVAGLFVNFVTARFWVFSARRK